VPITLIDPRERRRTVRRIQDQKPDERAARAGMHDHGFATGQIFLKTLEVTIRIALGRHLPDDLPNARHKAVLTRTKL